MSEGNTGVRGILKFASVYDLYQSIVGTRAARDRLFDTYISFPAQCALLDVGCGSGELLEYLPASVRYTGVDINPHYISMAKKKYGDRGRFIRADVNEIGTLGLRENEFDVVVLFGVLHHLDDREALETLTFARSALKSGGIAFSVDGVYLERQSKIKRLILSKDRGQFVRSDRAYETLAKKIFPHTKTFIERDVLRIPTDYFIMKMTA